MTITTFVVSLVPLAAIAPAQDTGGINADVLEGRPYSPYADRAFPTNVYFGDTHVHTSLSTDAGASGTKLAPRDAYRYARGEQVTSNTGLSVKLRQPFDFFMITDHSDGMGLILDLMAGTPEIMADPDGKRFHEMLLNGGADAQTAAYELIAMAAQNTVPEALTYAPGNPAYKRVWDDIIQAAEEFNEPHRFTTFIAFEWTSLVSGNNLHRNVIFRDGPERARQVLPLTMSPPAGSPDPRDLWKWLQAYEDKTGGDILAIPHNGNLSNGMMFAMQDEFDNGRPYDRDYAETRLSFGCCLRIPGIIRGNR